MKHVCPCLFSVSLIVSDFASRLFNFISFSEAWLRLSWGLSRLSRWTGKVNKHHSSSNNADNNNNSIPTRSAEPEHNQWMYTCSSSSCWTEVKKCWNIRSKDGVTTYHVCTLKSLSDQPVSLSLDLCRLKILFYSLSLVSFLYLLPLWSFLFFSCIILPLIYLLYVLNPSFLTWLSLCFIFHHSPCSVTHLSPFVSSLPHNRSTCWLLKAPWDVLSRSPLSSSSVTRRPTWPSFSSCCWLRNTSPAPTCTCKAPHPPSWSGWFCHGCLVCTPRFFTCSVWGFFWEESSVIVYFVLYLYLVVVQKSAAAPEIQHTTWKIMSNVIVNLCLATPVTSALCVSP